MSGFVMVGLVRDKNGNPKVDGDPKNLHPSIKQALTKKDKEFLGLSDEEEGVKN